MRLQRRPSTEIEAGGPDLSIDQGGPAPGACDGSPRRRPDECGPSLPSSSAFPSERLSPRIPEMDRKVPGANSAQCDADGFRGKHFTTETQSAPGELIFRQPATWIVHVHAMRQIRSPRPKYEIPVLPLRPRCETRTRMPAVRADEDVVNGRRPDASLGKRAAPAAGHSPPAILPCSALPLSVVRSAMFGAIDVVGAKHARIDTMGEA